MLYSVVPHVDYQLLRAQGTRLTFSFAIGRKNWLHLGSKEAGPKIAAIFSAVESCRRLNIPIRKLPC